MLFIGRRGLGEWETGVIAGAFVGVCCIIVCVIVIIVMNR